MTAAVGWAEALGGIERWWRFLLVAAGADFRRLVGAACLSHEVQFISPRPWSTVPWTVFLEGQSGAAQPA